MNLLELVKRIETATDSSWWLLALLLFVTACASPTLATLELAAIALATWYFTGADMGARP